MLYLAELNKPSFGKASLQLLARQQQQDVWQPVNEEAISLDGKAAQDANRIKDGALVLADINNSRQILQLREAAKQLVAYLQSYARLQEKAKTQEEEVEVWKQSLSFQHQALQERELELNQRQEELEHIALEYQKYAEELRTLESRREEIQSGEAYIAEQQQIIGQQREQLNHQLATLQQSRLSETDAAQLRSLVEQVTSYLDLSSGTPIEQLLHPLWDWINQRQEELNRDGSRLAEERQLAQHRQAELDQALQAVHRKQQDWWKSRAALESALAELKAQEASRKVRQDSLSQLSQQITLQDEINRSAFGLVEKHDFITAAGLGDRKKVEDPGMSVEELQAQVKHLRREFDQRSGQVSQQVAEFEQNRQILRDLQEKLATASPDDRFDIEMDIDYSQSACSALEEALAPQQERLQREQQELIRQEALLQRLLGDAQSSPTSKMPSVEIGPLLAQLEDQKQLQQEEKERLDHQIQQLDSVLRSQQETLSLQRQELEQTWKQLGQEEQGVYTQLQSMAETWGRLNFHQALLSARQEQLRVLQQQMETMTSHLRDRQNCINSWREHIEGVQQVIATLSQTQYQGQLVG